MKDIILLDGKIENPRIPAPYSHQQKDWLMAQIYENAVLACVGMPTGPLKALWQGFNANGTMATVDSDPPSEPPTPLKEAEDRVTLWLNGGRCQKTTHEAASTLDKLIALKMLRLEFPHQSTNVKDLDLAITREAKK